MLDIGEARKELAIFGDELLLPPCTTHIDHLVTHNSKTYTATSFVEDMFWKHSCCKFTGGLHEDVRDTLVSCTYMTVA